MVVASSVWPFNQSMPFEIPPVLNDCIDRFTQFYTGMHSGRKLSWLLMMCRGELTSHGFPRKYTFVVCFLNWYFDNWINSLSASFCYFVRWLGNFLLPIFSTNQMFLLVLVEVLLSNFIPFSQFCAKSSTHLVAFHLRRPPHKCRSWWITTKKMSTKSTSWLSCWTWPVNSWFLISSRSSRLNCWRLLAARPASRPPPRCRRLIWTWEPMATQC